MADTKHTRDDLAARAFTNQTQNLLAERDHLREMCAELAGLLGDVVDGRPTKEPPRDAVRAHANWQMFERIRAALARYEEMTDE